MSVPLYANRLQAEYTQIKCELCALKCKACCSRIAVCAGCALFGVGSTFSCCTGQTQQFSNTEYFYCRNMCWGNCCESADYYLSKAESKAYRDKSVELQKISREMEIGGQLARRVFPNLGGETLAALKQEIIDYQRETPSRSPQRMA